MYHDDFDPLDDGFSFGSADFWEPERYGFDAWPALILEENVLVLHEDEDSFRNLRVGVPGGRSWKVKVNWPLVRKLGTTYGPTAATIVATAYGVPLPVAAAIGQAVGETLKSEEKPAGGPPAPTQGPSELGARRDLP